MASISSQRSGNAAADDLGEVFVDCSSSPFGLASAAQNESTGLSESLRGGRAHLLAISKTGSGAYPEHPLIKPQSRAKIFLPLSGLSSLKFQNQTQENSTKEFHLSCSQSIPVVCS